MIVFHFQTVDPAEVKIEPEVDIKVDDTPNESCPSTSVGHKPPSASFHGNSTGSTSLSRDMGGAGEFSGVSEDGLNSGMGNLGGLDFDLNIVPEDLIQLVGDNLLEPDGDRDIF